MKKPISIDGKKFCIIDGYFRIEYKDGSFIDCKLTHSDIYVTVTDKDAYLYQNNTGEYIVDHAPETLGLNIEGPELEFPLKGKK